MLDIWIKVQSCFDVSPGAAFTIREHSKRPITFTESKLVLVAWTWTIHATISLPVLQLLTESCPPEATVSDWFSHISCICNNNYIHVCLPVSMCWRASWRFLKPTASHWWVLSKYMAAMRGRVMLIMFCSPQPEGCWIRVPIDFPLMAFSTSAPICSLPAWIHRNNAEF